jgi:aldehyde dehydrogenase (NAD(P)+)
MPTRSRRGSTLASPATTSANALDAAVARVREAAPGWARASLGDRLSLVHALRQGTARTAERAVQLACQAKGIPLTSPQAGEEWLSGPYVVLRHLNQLATSLRAIGRTGTTPLGRARVTADGRVAARVFPLTGVDAALFPLVTAEAVFEAGVGLADLPAARASFYRAPHGGRSCLVLGAGNINSIPFVDVLTRLFNDGCTCVLKVNPVNGYLAEVVEEAFGEAVRRGVLAVVRGGGEEGAYLCGHPGIDEVHLTGATATHDLVVWGPSGPEREARLARGQPLLGKPITSELGNVAPVLVVPGAWSERALRFQAESVAGMVTLNGAYNCNAARVLVTPRGWRLRQRFLALLEAALASSPTRLPWYPGARERQERFTAGRGEARRVGGADGTLPWTLLPGLDPEADDLAWREEAFCPVLAETSLGSEDPVEFLAEATRFANQRLFGTLNAMVVVPSRFSADPATAAALEGAVRDLRYGSVSVNAWAAYAFAFGTTPWGGYPGATLAEVESGIGLVHNSLMLERVEKCVVRHPAWTFPKPPYFPSHRTAGALGRRMVAVEAGLGWGGVPGVVAAAVRG